jgi:phage terminase large subunit
VSLSRNVEIPEVFEPLLANARYKGAHGGRGSGKSHFFALMVVLRAAETQTRIVCIREVQDTIKDSVRQLLVDKIASLGLGFAFDILESEIRGRYNGSLIIFRGMQSYNADNIKSLENFDIAWVEEAQTLSERSFDLLRPTIRADKSELWFGWNPRHKNDVVDKFFRGTIKYPGAICVEANWIDNPWFPDVLKQEKQADYASDPDKADYVWGGKYETITEGSYYARLIVTAEKENRVRDFEIDRELPVHSAWDLGKGERNPIWCFQVKNDIPYIVDFLKPETDDISDWVAWLNARAYHGIDYVPHDIMVQEWGTSRTRYEILQGLNRKPKRVASVSVQDGRAAARETITRAVFHKTNCELGVDGLKHYRREWDSELGRFKDTAFKDWADHIADGFRYLALAWRVAPKGNGEKLKPKELEYTVKPSGLIQGNMGVRDAVEAMIKRKRGE